jgi:maltose O-acetyltransferase
MVATLPTRSRGTGRAGVPPLLDKQLRTRHLRALAAIPHDLHMALIWLGRGPLATSPLLPLPVRRALLRLGGVKLGAMVSGLDRCYFGSPNVSIGTGSYINAGLWVEGAGQVEIGGDCMFGPQVLILTSTHAVGPDAEISRRSEFHGVRIEDGCWICARAVIQPGVTIGAGAIVAAGAVVTADCEPGGMYGGVPAQRLR